jgi:hypothetical protein
MINEYLLGPYKDGKKNGKGTYYFANANKFIGDWIDDHRTGQCVFLWTNGDRYEGQIKDGYFNGNGTKYFANGNKYTGDWFNDKMEGHGIYTWPNGDRYERKYSEIFRYHCL